MKKLLLLIAMWSVLATAQQYTIFDMNGKNIGSFNEIISKRSLDKFIKESHGSVLVKKGTTNKTESLKVLNNRQLSQLQINDIQKNIDLKSDSLEKENWK